MRKLQDLGFKLLPSQRVYAYLSKFLMFYYPFVPSKFTLRLPPAANSACYASKVPTRAYNNATYLLFPTLFHCTIHLPTMDMMFRPIGSVYQLYPIILLPMHISVVLPSYIDGTIIKPNPYRVGSGMMLLMSPNQPSKYKISCLFNFLLQGQCASLSNGVVSFNHEF